MKNTYFKTIFTFTLMTAFFSSIGLAAPLTGPIQGWRRVSMTDLDVYYKALQSLPEQSLLVSNYSGSILFRLSYDGKTLSQSPSLGENCQAPLVVANNDIITICNKEGDGLIYILSTDLVIKKTIKRKDTILGKAYLTPSGDVLVHGSTEWLRINDGEVESVVLPKIFRSEAPLVSDGHLLAVESCDFSKCEAKLVNISETNFGKSKTMSWKKTDDDFTFDSPVKAIPTGSNGYAVLFKRSKLLRFFRDGVEISKLSKIVDMVVLPDSRILAISEEQVFKIDSDGKILSQRKGSFWASDKLLQMPSGQIFSSYPRLRELSEDGDAISIINAGQAGDSVEIAEGKIAVLSGDYLIIFEKQYWIGENSFRTLITESERTFGYSPVTFLDSDSYLTGTGGFINLVNSKKGTVSRFENREPIVGPIVTSPGGLIAFSSEDRFQYILNSDLSYRGRFKGDTVAKGAPVPLKSGNFVSSFSGNAALRTQSFRGAALYIYNDVGQQLRYFEDPNGLEVTAPTETRDGRIAWVANRNQNQGGVIQFFSPDLKLISTGEPTKHIGSAPLELPDGRWVTSSKNFGYVYFQSPEGKILKVVEVPGVIGFSRPILTARNEIFVLSYRWSRFGGSLFASFISLDGKLLKTLTFNADEEKVSRQPAALPGGGVALTYRSKGIGVLSVILEDHETQYSVDISYAYPYPIVTVSPNGFIVVGTTADDVWQIEPKFGREKK